MGISKIMQPRGLSQPSVERPPSLDPASIAGVSHGALVSTVDAPESVPTHELPSPANRKYGVTPRPRKPRVINDKKLRRTIGLIVALKVQGKTQKEIAEELGLTANTVQTYLYRARKKGYLDTSHFDNPNDVLETIIRPKVVENVEALLDWRHPKTGLPSMDMTIETAKGIGVFQQHTVAKGNQPVATSAFALKVQVILPPDGITAIARTGTMGGRQAVEGEVIESAED